MARKDLFWSKCSKKWRFERNYRQIRNENGDTTAFVITIEGQNVEVTEEIYRAYSKADRRERYLVEQDNEHGTTLYSDLDTGSSVVLELSSDMSVDPLAESMIKQIMIENVHKSLQLLSQSEREFIICRYWEGITQKALAEQMGMSQQAISYREKQILKKLKKFFSKL